MPEATEQKIVQYLYDAHATELMLAQTITAHLAITPPGDYRDALELHLRETSEHAERIQKHLSRRERERGMIQVGYGIAVGVFSQVIAMGKVPVDLVRGMSGEELLLKNARDESASEAMEIAQYLAIEQLAKEVGDASTARLAASIRKDEEAMLVRLQRLIPRLAADVSRAEEEGTTFDVMHIGAVDAARSVAGSAARIISRGAGRAGRKAEQSKQTSSRTPATSRSTTSARGSSTTRKATTAKRSTKRTGTSTGAAKRTTSTKPSTAKRTTAKASTAKRTTAKRTTAKRTTAS